MIEVLSADRCISCDICVEVCPTDVFDRVPGSPPVVARMDDCQSCYQCEAYCPAEAIFVAPMREPVAEASPWRDEAHLVATGELGSYRVTLGWRRGASHFVRPPSPVTGSGVPGSGDSTTSQTSRSGR
jgi:NAD-dependent dihydropyrimidine dehydrogenase PreA subunit